MVGASEDTPYTQLLGYDGWAEVRDREFSRYSMLTRARKASELWSADVLLLDSEA